jgi:hypothetical protein
VNDNFNSSLSHRHIIFCCVFTKSTLAYKTELFSVITENKAENFQEGYCLFNVTSCSLVGSYCVRGTCYLSIQSILVNPEGEGSKLLLNIANYLAACMAIP